MSGCGEFCGPRGARGREPRGGGEVADVAWRGCGLRSYGCGHSDRCEGIVKGIWWALCWYPKQATDSCNVHSMLFCAGVVM